MKFSFLVHRRVLAAALLATTCATVALAQSPAASAAAPIRIGMIEGLSGPFANTGEAVYRNLVWATERVNARGGVKLPGGNRPLVIERFDSKGQTEEALSA
ncbi:MAG: ABC transporter substrate-binding protein, partial [Hydrogenophaga sp.]|nr:ABC transporter substrate-binding protein [Hydrogenophaga sp.]